MMSQASVLSGLFLANHAGHHAGRLNFLASTPTSMTPKLSKRVKRRCARSSVCAKRPFGGTQAGPHRVAISNRNPRRPARCVKGRSARRTVRTAASVPVPLRSHDRYRDLRAAASRSTRPTPSPAPRLGSKPPLPPFTIAPTPGIPAGFRAAVPTACTGHPDRDANSAKIPPRNAQARAPAHADLFFEPKRLRSNLPASSRFRALAPFRRRTIERADSLAIAGVRKPAQ
jgi:hypothetical protein